MPRADVQPVVSVDTDELVELYDAVGWTVYTRDPAALHRAIEQSSYVAVMRGDRGLIGLVRGLSDDVSILYVQDQLVHPDRQGEGLGMALLDHILGRYAHVRQKVLLTDDEPRQHRLYESQGFADVTGIDRIHAFARFDSVLGDDRDTLHERHA
jgi:GNAT superfamily N-acetyltransferase